MGETSERPDVHAFRMFSCFIIIRPMEFERKGYFGFFTSFRCLMETFFFPFLSSSFCDLRVPAVFYSCGKYSRHTVVFHA